MRRSPFVKLGYLGAILVVLACLAGPSPLAAQVSKGSISGHVVDASGGRVPSAQVKAVETGTGATASTETNDAGDFHLNLLPVGSYNLTISKQNFKTLVLNAVAVSAAQDNGLGEVKLEVGQQVTQVEVSAAAPLLQSTQAQISNSISNNYIQEFPGLSGNTGLDQLAIQIPGVVATRDNNFSNTNGLGFSANGIRGRNNDQQIDGQFNNDNSVAGPAMFVGNPDFVQEYQITTSNFGAEYGRNSGSVVNIITKSGTNSIHGDVFVVEANNKLNSLSNTQKAFEGLTKLPVKNDEFSGFSIGGPIIRDKLFAFGGFDNEIIPGSNLFSTGSLTPTPAGLTQLAGCFPNSDSLKALTAYGPFGVTGGNPQESGGVTPVTIYQVDAYGAYVYNTPGDPSSGRIPLCSAVPFSGIKRLLNTAYHQYDHMEKVDFNTEKDRFSFRYIYQKATNANSTGTASTGYSGDVPSFANQVGLSWTRTFSPTMVNELRLSYGRSTVQFGGNNYGNTLPPMSALATGLASISLGSGYAGFGPANNLPQGRIINSYQIQDNWNWYVRQHQIKIGENFTYQRSPNVFLPNYNGTFSFTNVSAFMANIPSSISITLGNPNLDFREKDTFLYFGDDWKVRQDLTLNLGLTWSYFGQPANLFHDYTVARESGSNPFFNPALPLEIRTFPQLSAPKNAFGPSIGFAWAPGSGKTAFRGGYRIAYDPPFYNIYLNIASAAPQVLAQTISTSSGAGFTAPPLLASPVGPANRAELASYLTLGVSDPRGSNVTTVAPNFKQDKVQSWSFGVQHRFGGHAVLESRYVGNHGGNLFQSINGNPRISGIANLFPNLLPAGLTPCPAGSAVVPTATNRVDCNHGVERIRTNTAYSDYAGWQNEFRTTNLWNQLTMRTSYTFSKTTDNVSEIFGSFYGGNTLAFSQDPLNYTTAEHGLSGLDIPNSWTLSFVEQIPFKRDQQGALGRILGGWQLAGSYIAASGQVYTPTQQYLAYLSYAGNGVGTSGMPFDTSFNSTFNSAVSYENLRPFLSNPNAPATQVGILAADACSYLGIGCTAAPNTLLNFNAGNTTGAEQTVSASQVRYVVNGPQSEQVHGTPFGDAARNSLRDAATNTANFTLYKYTNITERVKVRFDATFLNVFNHPNFYSIDAYIDDAGVAQEEYGFAQPNLFSGGGCTSCSQRQIKFGLRVEF